MKKRLKQFFTLSRRSNGGFTLVELIVVIAILAILAGTAVPAYSGYINKANEAADQQLLAALNTAYASACMENGEFDMTNLGFTPQANNIQSDVTIEPYNEAFKMYFGNGAFKYYDYLGFVDGVFKGNTKAAIIQAFKEYWNNGTHSFKGEEGELLGVFDAASGMFSGFDFEVEEFLFNFSEDLMAATGLGDIFGGIQENMQLTPEEIAAYEAELGRPLTEDEKSVIMGNKAVLQMAQAAAVADVDAVKTDVGNFIDIVKNANDTEWVAAQLAEMGVDYNQYLESYFLENGDTKAVEEYKTTGNPAILNEFLDGTNYVNISGRDAAILALAAEDAGTTNTTGVNTLGSLYALAAGYYNQEGSVELPGNVSLGSFDAFVYAVSEDPTGFYNYYTSQGEADVDAYLSFMGALSTGDVELTDEGAFSGMSDYITELLK